MDRGCASIDAIGAIDLHNTVVRRCVAMAKFCQRFVKDLSWAEVTAVASLASEFVSIVRASQRCAIIDPRANERCDGIEQKVVSGAVLEDSCSRYGE